MAPKFLAEVLKELPGSSHPDLLVGFNKADDAGVFKINETQALVQTVDFFPPIVDDPYQFGQIAAANALSDIYAMGGTPLTALNIVGFPAATMPPEILSEILRGGGDKVEEAGAVVVGGHSIKDKELKYGIAVTGMIHPEKVISNSGAKAGDVLILTKPLGTGLITTGIKRGAVSPEIEQLVTKQMAQLNKVAAELMGRFKPHAATDITGFGLLGHAFEMADGSAVTIKLDSASLPLMPTVLDLVKAGMIPGGAKSNRDYLSGKVSVSGSVDADLEAVMYDPQTSGGLLIAFSEEDATNFLESAAKEQVSAAKIGLVESAGEFALIVE